jgi:hypothetical protein
LLIHIWNEKTSYLCCLIVRFMWCEAFFLMSRKIVLKMGI